MKRTALIPASILLLALSGCLYFGPGSPQQSGEKTYFGNNNCLFEEQGFDCGSTRAYAENGRTHLDLNLVNRYGKPVTIKRISCVYGNTDSAFGHAYMVEAGLVSGRDYRNDALGCVDSSGNPVPAYPEFRGKLLVWFNYADDLDQNTQHVASATMISS
ncbi:MAG: hypothetical protein PHD43_23220 [Methylococcales bacterium]|nr:hypothetical protein [Candidatus ainarchaeum sp.]MDD5096735.1 hypothetical protein [Candidatus ainarchaeum sp.]MDD5323460.1 hypothetical protein [Methylococcales bacterium]